MTTLLISLIISCALYAAGSLWFCWLWWAQRAEVDILETENKRLAASRQKLMADLHQADAAVRNARRLLQQMELDRDNNAHRN